VRRIHRRLAAVVVTTLAVGALTMARAGAQPTATENAADPGIYDPYFAEQWALQALHVPVAWSRSTGAGVRVGVVDTGVDLAHEDLAGKVTVSTSCIGADDVAAACQGTGQDDEGHGTHVAGIIAADTFNGKGVASVAPGAQLVVAKALDASGSGALEDVNAGIKWVVDHGARIVNLSVEADGTQLSVTPGQSMAEGIEYAWHHGAIPVVAAGNATPSLFGPAGYAGIDAVVVGATGRSGEPAWYSSPLTGAKWGIVAPGGDARSPAGTASCAGPLAGACIVSTGWFAGHTNAYADDEGTSMAAPEVSGVLALLIAQGLSPQAAINRLLVTADPLACGAGCGGAADAAAAVAPGTPVRYGANRPPPSPPPATTSPPAPGRRVRTGSPPVPAGAVPPPTSSAPVPGVTPTRATPASPPAPQLAAGPPPAPVHAGRHALAIVVAVVLLVVVSVLLAVEATARAVRRRGG
jgi:subtilisin family serine protease